MVASIGRKATSTVVFNLNTITPATTANDAIISLPTKETTNRMKPKVAANRNVRSALRLHRLATFNVSSAAKTTMPATAQTPCGRAIIKLVGSAGLVVS